MKRIILIFTVCFLVWGCKKTTATIQQLSNYNITVKLDTAYLSLNCMMQVDWFNSSDSIIDKIPFTFKLDSAKTLVKDITINKKIQNFTYTSKETNGFEGFIVYLSEPVAANENVNIQINFSSKQNEYFREKMLLFENDFPLIQHFNGEIFNPYFKVHSDFQVEITYPQEFNIAVTGLIETTDTIDNYIKNHTTIKSVPSFGFVLLKDIKLKEDSTSGVLIRSFYFEDDSKWGEKLLEYSKNIIAFYKDTIGFYPQPVLTIIPGYSKPYGGWPVCPNIVGIHRGIDSKKEKAETHAHWVMSHEIGHQYWGYNYILEPINYPQWFGIGMGIHTDRLYAIKNIPEFNHSKYFSRSYLKAMQKGYNTTIMQTVDTLNKQGFDWNNSIKHNKAFYVLQMLAYEIGEDAFYEIFKYCLDNYKGVNVTLEMFKNTCETISKQNLDEFFHTWFFTNNYLEYQIDSVITTKNSNQFQNEIKIRKIGTANISSIVAEIELAGNEKIKTQFDGNKQTETLKIVTEKPIEKIILDPELKLLLVNRKDWNRNN